VISFAEVYTAFFKIGSQAIEGWRQHLLEYRSLISLYVRR